jgi:hypothetical protein
MVFVALSATAGPACSGGATTTTASGGRSEEVRSIGTSADACPALAANVTLVSASGDIIITSACMRDELGNLYPSGLSDTDAVMPIVPAGHSYAMVYQFAPAYTPRSSGLSSVSQVYVAPDNINGDPSDPQSYFVCLPEDSSSNLVASKATLEGSLLVQQIVGEVASGEQVDAVLDLGAILPGNCKDGGPCGSGFNVRFYVGSVPPAVPVYDGSSCGDLVP